MKMNSQAKMFLADERGLQEGQSLRRFSTFNFGAFSNPYKAAEDQLYLLNEDWLAAGQQTEITIEKDSYFVLLPLTGSVVYIDSAENGFEVEVECVMSMFMKSGSRFSLSNGYEHDAVNYLYCCLEASQPDQYIAQHYSFDLSVKNKLLRISDEQLPFSIHIGRFDGRNEVLHTLNKQNKIYAFVIAGAFEVSGRLLHEKDGLALWDTPEIDMEALSNNALILTIEWPFV